MNRRNKDTNDLAIIYKASKLCNYVGIIILGLFLNTFSVFSTNDTKIGLETTIQKLEKKLDARIGVLVRDSASDWQWGHRENERFPMNSTFKSVLCGAILSQVDQGALTLDETLAVPAEKMIDYSPVTKQHIGKMLSIGELCFATLNISDNTAANLLIDRLGGTHKVNAYLRRIGDTVTRLDRLEPDLNTYMRNDPRDTTTPGMMLSTWKTMLLGNSLTTGSRKQLTEWMSHGGVTGKLIRVNTPANWLVADKSGGGRHYTRSIVAMVTPPNEKPYFVAIFISDTPANWSDRNNAVTEIGAAIIEIISKR